MKLASLIVPTFSVRLVVVSTSISFLFSRLSFHSFLILKPFTWLVKRVLVVVIKFREKMWSKSGAWNRNKNTEFWLHFDWRGSKEESERERKRKREREWGVTSDMKVDGLFIPLDSKSFKKFLKSRFKNVLYINVLIVCIQTLTPASRLWKSKRHSKEGERNLNETEQDANHLMYKTVQIIFFLVKGYRHLV